MARPLILYAIGYQRLDADIFWRALATVGARVLVDTRARPEYAPAPWRGDEVERQSAAHGMSYRSLEALGSPFKPPLWDLPFAELATLYRAEIFPRETAQQALLRLRRWAEVESVALLCSCRSHRACHRALIAEAIGAEIRDLIPESPAHQLSLFQE